MVIACDLQDAAYEDFNWRSCAYEVGCSLEEEPYRCDSGRGEQAEVDPALNDLVLDTPPDMLEVRDGHGCLQCLSCGIPFCHG